MKTIRFGNGLKLLAMAVALALVVPCQASEQDAEWQDPEIDTIVQPLYPSSLSAAGILDGSMTILVALDNQGTVIDWLPVSTSNDDFIPAVSNVVYKWKFIPAKRGGENVASAVSVTLNFKMDGFIMSMNGFGLTHFFLFGSLDMQQHSLVSSFSQLDGLPEPVSIVQPALSVKIPEGTRKGEVVMMFFIDNEGNVRMPELTKCDGDIRLAYAAYDALVQWKFKPPVRNGRTTTVRASQRFIFNEDTDAAPVSPKPAQQ